MNTERENVRDIPASPAMSRRDILMSTAAAAATGMIATIGAPFLAAGLSPAEAAEASKKPNIVFILVDDLGWKDVGYHGSDIKTPNIDKLATSGARLEDFYVQPMCTPTRAALMTGRYPLRYGLQTGVIPSAGKYGLATDEYLLPQLLHDAGYQTAIVGKWHLGHADQKYWPKQRGFDSSYGPLIGEIDHFKHSSHGVRDWFRDNREVKETGYDTMLLGAEAVKLIDHHDTKVPLFLYLAFTAAHTPYQAPEKYLQMYSGIADPQRRAYAGQITAMDEQVGKVVDALDKKGMRDDTLIMFVSDNGGTRSKMFAGEAAVEGELPPNNGPYRDGKGNLYEGGTRVVAIANWPAHIQPGEITQMMHVVDMYPTFGALAGATLGKNKPLDGVDVWATLSDRKAVRDEVVYNIEPYRAGIREGDMKLVWVALIPPSVELFDLSKDAGETTNIADQNPDVVKRLQDRAIDLGKQAQPPLFLTEMVRLGLSHVPDFGDLGGLSD